MTHPVAVIVLSGGQDSTFCAFWARHQGYELHAVTFDYGQRHRIEIESARKVAGLAGCVSHEVIDIKGTLVSASPLLSANHLEQYKDHQSLPGGLEKTFVPMRNQLFLTIAANRAYARGCRTLIIGVCQEDSGGYPDCRDEFISAFSEASELGTFTEDTGLSILCPLMFKDKAESVRMAVSIPGCYNALAYSHTSYDGQYPPTGRDHATLLRAKGFEQAGVPDPLILRAWKEGLMHLPKSDNYSNDKVTAFTQDTFWKEML